jgi:hypothetical protein
MLHELKTWPEYFGPVWEGRKTFELRNNDRHFQEGDELVLREYDPISGYSGRRIYAKVGFVLSGGFFGLPENLCIMSILHTKMLDVDESALAEGWKLGPDTAKIVTMLLCTADEMEVTAEFQGSVHDYAEMMVELAYMIEILGRRISNLEDKLDQAKQEINSRRQYAWMNGWGWGYLFNGQVHT